MIQSSRLWTGYISRSLSVSVVGMSLAASPALAQEDPASQSSTAAAESAPLPEDVLQNENVPTGLIQLPVSSNYYSPYAFVVDKAARTLSVWQQTPTGLKKVVSFPADS